MQIVTLKWSKIAWHEAFNLVASISQSGTGTIAFTAQNSGYNFAVTKRPVGWDFPAIDLQCKIKCTYEIESLPLSSTFTT
jgi:hypothetical protein